MYERDWRGEPNVIVYWDLSDGPGYAWVAYVSLTEWLNTATHQSAWGNAIQWTEGRPVGTPPRPMFLHLVPKGQHHGARTDTRRHVHLHSR